MQPMTVVRIPDRRRFAIRQPVRVPVDQLSPPEYRRSPS